MNWKDIYMNEDAPEKPVTDLPTDNEAEGEDNGQGSPAAGALPEDENNQGMETVPTGEDEITGTDSTEYDDAFSFLRDGDDDTPEDGDGDGDGVCPECGNDPCTCGEGKGGETEGKKRGKKKSKKARKNMFSFMDEDAPENPTEDLPEDNEEEGEDNGQDSEAAGAMSEDDDPDGMTTVPAGEDEITGTKSTEYDNVFSFLDKEGEDTDPEGEPDPDAQPEDQDEEDGEEPGETEGKKRGKKKSKKARKNSFSIFDTDDDPDPEDGDNKPGDDDDKPEDGDGDDDKPEDGDTKGCGGRRKKSKKGKKNFWEAIDEGEEGDGDKKKEGDGEDKPDDDKPEGSDDDDVNENGKETEGAPKDMWSFFDSEDVVDPENLPGDPSAPEPVDGNGDAVDPNGDPEPNADLTTPIVQPVETENGDTTALQNRKNIRNRYFFD